MLVFEQLADAAPGTKLLRLYSDASGRSAYILKIGTGKAAKPVRLLANGPLAKAMAAVDHELPDELVALLSSTSTSASANSSVRPGPALTLTLTLPARWLRRRCQDAHRRWSC